MQTNPNEIQTFQDFSERENPDSLEIEAERLTNKFHGRLVHILFERRNEGANYYTNTGRVLDECKVVWDQMKEEYDLEGLSPELGETGIILFADNGDEYKIYDGSPYLSSPQNVEDELANRLDANEMKKAIVSVLESKNLAAA